MLTTGMYFFTIVAVARKVLICPAKKRKATPVGNSIDRYVFNKTNQADVSSSELQIIALSFCLLMLKKTTDSKA